MKPTVTSLCAAALALVTSCGGGSDDGGNFSTGLDGSKQVSDLSDSDFKKVCDAEEKWASSVLSEQEAKEFGCQLTAFATAAFAGAGGDAAQLKMACKAAYDACLKQPPPSSMMPSTMKMCNKPANCTATVAEIEACYTDSAASLEMLKQALTCDALANTSMPPAIQEPASCKTLDMKCPGLSPDTPDIRTMIGP